MKRRPFALRPVCAAVLLLGVAPLAFGLPEGAVPTFGQTTVKQTSPGRLDIVQTTDRAGLDWTRFSIGAGERVVVRQPGSSSILLNRVVGNDPTYIYGRLQSNGGVWLVNPRGIVFGANSRVDVGSLLASTLSIAGGELNPGRVVLGAEPGAGALQADGHIRARDGSVVLAAPDLSMRGVIEARRVGLPAASDVVVDVEGDGLMLFKVRNDGQLATRLSLLGEVRADGGSAEVRAAARAGFADTVLNLGGVVRARGIGQRDGRVVIDGGDSGITRVAGTVDVSGREAGQTGGSAQVLGHWVLLDEGADVDASGRAGGGQVRVGGGWQGRDAALHNADALIAMPGSRVRADALDTGDGGSVVLWSDRSTQFHGRISALGGARGGNGGEVEVSGKQNLLYQGDVDLRAPRGSLGNLLLDPTDITIGAGGTDTFPADPLSVPVIVQFTDNAAGSNSYTAAEVNRVLGQVNLTLQATNDITILANTAISGSRQLTLQAGGDISIGNNASVSANAGITLTANATSGQPNNGAVTINNGASLTASGASAVIQITNTGSSGTNTFATGNGTVSLTASAIQLSGNTASKTGSGTLALNGAVTGTLAVGQGTLQLGGGGTTGSGTFQLGNNTVLDVVAGSQVTNPINFASGATAISITSSSGGGTVSGSAVDTLSPRDGMTLKLGSAGGGTLTVARAIAANSSSTATEKVEITSGTVQLSPVSGATSSYTGLTTLDAGAELSLGNVRGISSGSYQIGDGATLDLGGTFSFGRPISIASGATTATINASSGNPDLATATSSLALPSTVTLNLSADGGSSLTLNRTISSSGALRIDAGDVEIGTGSTTLTGGTTIANGATLTTTATNQLSNSSELTVNGALVVAASDTVPRIGGSGSIEQQAGRLVISNGGTFTGTITGAGGLSLTSGTLVLNQANSYAAGTNVSDGATLRLSTSNTAAGSGRITLLAGSSVLDITDGANIGNAVTANNGATITSSAGDGILGSGSMTVADGATLKLSAGSGSSLSVRRGIVANSASTAAENLEIVTGDVELRSATTIAGTTTVDSAATLSTTTAGRLSTSSALTVEGALVLAGAESVPSLAGGGDLTLTAGRLTIANGGSFTGPIDGNGGITLSSGTLTLSNASNSYADGTTVNGGTLRLSRAAAGTGTIELAAGTVLDITSSSGTTSLSNAVTLDGDASIGSSTGNGTLAAGTMTLADGATLSLSSGTGTLTIARGIPNQAGGSAESVTVTGGTVVLGAASGYTGGTLVSDGTLRLTDAAAAGGGTITLGSNRLEIGGGQTVANNISVTTNATLAAASGGGTLSGGTVTVLNQGGRLNLAGNSSGGTLTFGDTLAVSGGGLDETVSITGGQVNLGTALTITGATTVNNGATLSTTAANRLSDNGTLVVNGTLAMGGADTVPSLSGSGTLTLPTVSTDRLTLASGGSFNGTVEGTGGLALSTGTLTLSNGGNTFQGGTVVNGGTLRLSATGAGGAGLISLAASGATLDITTGASVANNVSAANGALITSSSGGGTLASGGTLTLTDGGTLNLSSTGGTLTVARAIPSAAGAGLENVTVSSGTVSLSGQVTVGGTTTVQNGAALTTVGSNRLANDALAVNGTLTLGGADTIGALSGSGTIQLQGNTLTLADGGSFDGSIGGSTGSELRLNAGTFVLNGSSTARSTNVQGGLFRLASAERLDDGSSLTVGSSGTLELNGVETVTTASIGGTLTDGSTGSRLVATTTTLTAATVGVDLGGGTLTVSGGTTALAVDIAVDTLNVAAGGVLQLTGSSAQLTNNTSVSIAGRLELGRNENLGTGTFELDGGTLAGTGTLRAASYLMDSGTTLAGANLGPGALESRGTSTLGGTKAGGSLTVSSGVLTFDDGNAGTNTGGFLVGSPSVTVNGGATLQLDGNETASAVNLSGTLAGTGTLTAPTYALDGGIVQAGLGAGALVSNGDSAIDPTGTSAANSLEVQTGTLEVRGANRLTGRPTVEVADGAVLDLQGRNQLGATVIRGRTTGTSGIDADEVLLIDGDVRVAITTDSLTSTGTSFLRRTATATSVTVSDGTLTLDDGNSATRNGGLLAGTTSITIGAGATLALDGPETTGTLTMTGSAGLAAALGGTGRLNATTANLANALVGASNTLAAATLTINADTTIRGLATLSTLQINAGTLTLDDGNAGTQAGGRLDGSPDVVVARNAGLQLDGPENVGSLSLGGTLGGTGPLTAPTYTLTDGAVVGASLGAGTLSSTGTTRLQAPVGATSVTVDSGTMTVAASALARTAAVTVQSPGTLALDGNDTIGTLTLAGRVAGNGTLTADTHALQGGSVGAGVTLAGDTLVSSGSSSVDGRLAVGLVDLNGGTLTLGSGGRLLNAPAVDLAGSATLALGGDEAIGNLTGSGTVALGAATLTAGTSASSRFDGAIEGDGGLVKQGSGTLTLGGVSSFTGTTQVVAGTLALDGAERLGGRGAIDIAGGTLSLDGDQHASALTMEGGRLDGSGSTLIAATYTLRDADVRADLGGGRLTSRGDTTLRGSASARNVTVADGQLTLTSAERLADNADVTVASGAALALQGDERIGTLSLSGTLDGSGVLRAATYALDSGTANAALGGGALSASGTSTIAGDAAVDSLSVDAGRLRITGTLSAAPIVTVDAGASLSVAVDQRIGSLAGRGGVTLDTGTTLRTGSAGGSTFSGTLDGAGSLLKEGTSTFTLAGAAGFTGGLEVADGTLKLAGTLATTSVEVSGGRLELSTADRLADNTNVSVARGATLTLGSTETIGTLQLAGTLAGAGTLSAATVTLDGAQVDANLGRGALVSRGASTLSGTAASDTVNVAAGTLTLSGSNRFSNRPDVGVASGATLQLDGSARAGSLQLDGTLAGSGTLTAARYALDGGLVQANLGAGALTSQGDSRIEGQVAADSVDVDAGTLTLGSAGRLTGAPALAIARGATLSLAGDESVGSLVLAGALTTQASGSTLAVSGNATLDSATLVGGLTLDAATTDSTGSSTLRGVLATETLTVQDGTLQLTSGGRLAARATARAGGPAVTVASGAVMRLGGNESVAMLEGAGRVELGDATLTAGVGGADSLFSGVIAGNGELVKEGSGTLTLAGRNTYLGTTTVAGGVLQLGNDGRGGSLASSEIVVEGTLRVDRRDSLTLAQAIRGTGGLEQAGSGTLVLEGDNKTYTGTTVVSGGTLATANADALSAASRVTVGAGAALTLVGSQQVQSLDVDKAGSVAISGTPGSTGTLTLAADAALNVRGAVTVGGDRGLTLSAASINAPNAGNRWGSRLNLDSAGRVELSAGEEGGTARDLTLGTVTIGGDAATPSSIEAGRLTLDGALQLGTGTLQLLATAAADPVKPSGDLLGRTTPAGRQIAFAADTVSETSRGSISVADGALLSVRTPGGGSVSLDAAANQFAGSLEVLTGDPTAPWSGNLVGSGANAYSMQSRVQITGDQVRVGGIGIVADVVRVTANRLGTDNGAVIVARLPFDNLDGTAQSVPGLTLELAPGAFGLDTPFGTVDFPIAVNVGSRSWGDRTEQVDAGFLSVLPRNGAQGATAVVLSGPSVVGLYDFFFEGNGNQKAIPVVYNGVLPDTPQAEGSISATLAVSEGARRQGFEEAVRTENVAPRLRAGVIAEVGPGRPATVGAEGARLPPVCNPAPGGLGCAPGAAPR